MDVVGQPNLLDQLRPTLSDARLQTYLTAAGFDLDRALRLYIWNAQIGEAFHILIQGAEVGLRNRIEAGLAMAYGPSWWCDNSFLAVADNQRKADIQEALRRIENREAKMVTSQMVATLSFGFWVGMLHRKYQSKIWEIHLRTALPHLPPDKGRSELAQLAKHVCDLRNRISHHEPLLNRDILQEYSAVLELLVWVCPQLASWLKPHCRVPALVRQKP